MGLELKVKYLEDMAGEAILPSYSTPGSAAMDLYAANDAAFIIEPGETYFIQTGIAIEIPEGYAGLVLPRSGLACHSGITLPNTPALIDSDYRGELLVPLKNMAPNGYLLRPGQRIAQLMIVPYARVTEITVVEKLSGTSRGSGGFGSTGE